MPEENLIKKCIQSPTTVDPNQYTTHQSIFRIYSQYNLLMEMLRRGDSIQTILMVMNYIESE